LTPDLLKLLQASVTIRSLEDRELAQILGRSPEIIRTEFTQIGSLLGTPSRFATVLMALEQGWIVLAPPALRPCNAE